MSEWQPKETAPKDGTRMLQTGVWNEKAAQHCQGDPYICIAMWGSWSSSSEHPKQWLYESNFGASPLEAVTFTHWQPLPAPPEQSEEA